MPAATDSVRLRRLASAVVAVLGDAIRRRAVARQQLAESGVGVPIGARRSRAARSQLADRRRDPGAAPPRA